ncbi:MAG TPA: hypothetical protein VM261_16770 [Kofleriaceae bacterium]|nr:hypothetical protein [Kofleriaceae bacterium]
MISAFAGSAWAQDGEEGGEEGGEEASGDPCGGEAAAEGSAEGMADESTPVSEAADGATMEGGAPPMILPTGKIGVHVTLGINLSTDAVAKPIAIAPDIWYGVMPKLEVGVVHSNYGLSGFWFQPGGGICVTGEENGCGKLYDGPVGLMANFLVSESASMDLAVNGGIVIGSFDPLPLSLKVGVKGRYKSGKIAVHFNPAIAIGLTERDGNKEEIMVPVMVGYAVNEKLHAGLQTGIAGPLDGFGDAFFVPVGLGALYGLNDKMSVGGAFNFVNLAGKNGGADFRTLDLMFMWHN